MAVTCGSDTGATVALAASLYLACKTLSRVPAGPAHHLSTRGPSQAPTPSGTAMPTTYQIAMNGNAASGQWKA